MSQEKLIESELQAYLRLCLTAPFGHLARRHRQAGLDASKANVGDVGRKRLDVLDEAAGCVKWRDGFCFLEQTISVFARGALERGKKKRRKKKKATESWCGDGRSHCIAWNDPRSRYSRGWGCQSGGTVKYGGDVSCNQVQSRMDTLADWKSQRLTGAKRTGPRSGPQRVDKCLQATWQPGLEACERCCTLTGEMDPEWRHLDMQQGTT